MKNIHIDTILNSIQELPPMPAVINKLLSIVGDPESSVNEIIQVIKFDEALVAKVLKVANSTVYNRSIKKIGTIEDALVRLGNNNLLNVIMAGTCSGYFNITGEGYGVDRAELWRNAIAASLLSARIADKIGFKDKNTLFAACMLHDIGKVILDTYIKENAIQVDLIVNKHSTEFNEVEQNLFGVNHAEVGAKIVESWDFPEDIKSAILFHHNPEKSEKHKDLVYIVSLCDILCLMAGIGIGLDGLNYKVNQDILDRFNLSNIDIQKYLIDIVEDLKKTEEWLKNS